MVLNIIFGGITFISVSVLVLYRRQIKSIVQQIEFLRNQDTNKLISRQVSFKEVEELTENLNELMKKYRILMGEYANKDTQLKETITNISHDIRTPLTSLDGYFQLLQDCNAEEDRQRYYHIIGTRVDSLKEILEQLFTFVKLQNENDIIELEACNINEIVCEVLFSFYDDLKERSIEPEVEIPDQVCYCIAQEASLRRVVQNIIKNALDHGRDNLKVKVEEHNKKVCVTIANGCREEENIEVNKVFERFYKADSARTTTSTGLGLAIAKQLVYKMNGEIWATVEEGQFIITVSLNNQKGTVGGANYPV